MRITRRLTTVLAVAAAAVGLTLAAPMQTLASQSVPYGNQSSSEDVDVGQGTVGEVNCFVFQNLTESPDQSPLQGGSIVPAHVNTLTASQSSSCPIPGGGYEELDVSLSGPGQSQSCSNSISTFSQPANYGPVSCSVTPSAGVWTANFTAEIEVYEFPGTLPSGCTFGAASFSGFVTCNESLTTTILPQG
jgi:hypothetical protein